MNRRKLDLTQFETQGEGCMVYKYRGPIQAASDCTDLLSECRRLQAENARMREALQMICDSGIHLADQIEKSMLDALKEVPNNSSRDGITRCA